MEEFDGEAIPHQLRELLDMEVADLIATANEQGFSTKDVLSGLAATISASQKALGEDPDPAEDPSEYRPCPHSDTDRVDL